MTRPFAWINATLEAHGLTPPDWARLLSADDAPNIGNWRFFSRESSAKAAYRQINERYPSRQVLAFARDRGSDDIACFVLSDATSNAPIVAIHDYAAPGTEVEERFDSFEEWIAAVMSRADKVDL